MRKLYFLFFILCTAFSYGQLSESEESNPIATNSATETSNNYQILGFKMYPNPVSNGILNIVSKSNSTKSIQIFNILGKVVLSKILIGRQLNVSRLNAGIYILKIREKDKIVTRKLVIK